MDVADPLHAGDYKLITPRGHALSKEDYPGSIHSGELNNSVFEPVSEIAVRGSETIALLRYRARIAFHDRGPTEPFECWHTDCYEMRDGRWQARPMRPPVSDTAPSARAKPDAKQRPRGDLGAGLVCVTRCVRLGSGC